MMTSFIDNIPIIVRTVADLKPKNILDVGAAFGKYGLLISEALLSEQAEAGELFPEQNFKIVACENAKYFLEQKHLLAIYNRVMPEDIRTVSQEKLNEFDLILMIDIIEHWPKEDFVNLMKKVKFGTKVLISTPKKVSFYKLGYYGIDKHVSQFSDQDFNDIDISTKDSFIYLI